MSPSEIAYVRFIAIGRLRTLLLARELPGYLHSLGVEPAGIVHYRRTEAAAGYLNEVDVAAHLDVETWKAVSAWCERHFESLGLHSVIDDQLTRFLEHGTTGEEPYEGLWDIA